MRIMTQTLILILLLIGCQGIADPKEYTAESWWLGPHLDKYSDADQIARLNSKILARADRQEQSVILATDVRDVVKNGPGFLKVFTRALKNEPIETLARSTVNLGALVITGIAVAEGTDALGWTEFDILDRDDSDKKDPRPPVRESDTPTPGSIIVTVNDNKGEVTIVVGDDTDGTVQ